MVLTRAGAHTAAPETGGGVAVKDTSTLNATVESSLGGISPTGQPRAAVDALLTPVAPEAVPASEGTQQCSMSAALEQNLYGSAIATPTQDLVAELHATLAESRDAFQVQETPTSADPAHAGDSAEVKEDNARESIDGGTVTNEDVPVCGGIGPLATEPSDGVDIPSVSDEVTASVPCAARTDEEPLLMLSPVQADKKSQTPLSAAAAVEGAEVELEGVCGEVVGGDENSGVNRAADGGTPITSRFQIPADADALECEVQNSSGQEAAEDGRAAGKRRGIVDAFEHTTVDVAMESSDVAVEHDEDSCTRMDSPVPADFAATGACITAGLPSGAADVNPGNEGEAVEYLQTRSRDAMSPAAISVLCSPLRESTGASLVPCIT